MIGGGPQRHRSPHLSIADCAVEKIGDVAAFVALIEREPDEVAIEPPADWAFEQGRSLMPAELRAALLDIEPVNARALQKIDMQFPVSGDFDCRRGGRCGLATARFAQYRRD